MASNLVNITAYDVYNRMIELNFPEEMARLFQSKLKTVVKAAKLLLIPYY